MIAGCADDDTSGVDLRITRRFQTATVRSINLVTDVPRLDLVSVPYDTDGLPTAVGSLGPGGDAGPFSVEGAGIRVSALVDGSTLQTTTAALGPDAHATVVACGRATSDSGITLAVQSEPAPPEGSGRWIRWIGASDTAGSTLRWGGVSARVAVPCSLSEWVAWGDTNAALDLQLTDGTVLHAETLTIPAGGRATVLLLPASASSTVRAVVLTESADGTWQRTELSPPI
jgi:hypothetical protein